MIRTKKKYKEKIAVVKKVHSEAICTLRWMTFVFLVTFKEFGVILLCFSKCSMFYLKGTGEMGN